ncbi:hypothetical protein [Actinoplanes sp. NPDC051494]|uniref:hypothetical protein n=1 Tax=Actinoplanes sp. NPDC051494 TaxID=3363907 RepID=UPI003791DB65
MPRKPGPTFADLVQKEHRWIELAVSNDHRRVRKPAFDRLQALGVDLPPHPTDRDIWAAGIQDRDFQRERPVNPSRKLQRFESSTRYRQ